MARRIRFLLYCILMLMVGACESSTRVASLQVAQTASDGTRGASASVLNALDAIPGDRGVQDQTVDTDSRIILRSAQLRLIVEDAATALDRITTQTEAYGGWVVSSSSSRIALASGGEVAQASVTVRVPAERLDEALAQFKTGVVKVDSETVTGEDVTQDYVDTRSRVTNLEAAEAQLRQIMEQATDTDSVLNVYNELVRVRGDIETARGRLQYYDQASAYASVAVDLVPQAVDEPITVAGWNPDRTVQTALRTLVDVLRFVADAGITLVIVVLPVVALIGVPLWLIRRVYLRGRAARPHPQPSEDAA